MWLGREKKNIYRILVGNLNERDNLEEVGIDGRITLKWISKKFDGRAGTGLTF